jgi:UDP-GlcNAc:undecaprenyl-phosphate/decaprenyl-phosphate GlcNAc-1-phosphate transferase
MSAFTHTSLIVFFASLVLGACLTCTILRLASRLPWLTRSSSNRLHIESTPVWGGVAIFFSFTCVAISRGLLDNRAAIVLAICTGGTFLLGLCDDIWKLQPRWKLVGQVICAFALLLLVPPTPLTGNFVIDAVLKLFWVVGITNAFNLLDNINGLSAGTAVLVAGFQTLLFLAQGDSSRALTNIALCGAVIGFLFFNFPKGRIFMGDSGALFIGFWLAATGLSQIHVSAKNPLGFFLFPLLVMVVPISDTTLVTLTRMLKGHPVSIGGTDHLSHRLIAYGFSEKKAVLALWALSFLSGAFGVITVAYGLTPVLSIVTPLLVAVALFGTYLTRFELQAQSAALREATRYPRIAHWVRMSSKALFDVILIVAAYYTAYLFRFEGKISEGDFQLFLSTVAELGLIKLGVFVALGVYRPSWDYFGLKDAYRLVGASALASLIAVTYFSTVYRFYGFSRIVIVLDFLVFTLLTLVFRFSFRLFDELAPTNHCTNALIYGADSDGETALQLVSKHYRFRVVGFLDDDWGKRAFSIRSVPVRGCMQDLACLARKWNASVVLLTPSTTEETKSKLRVICSALEIRLLRLHHTLEDLTTTSDSYSSRAPVPGDLMHDESPKASLRAFSKAGSG